MCDAVRVLMAAEPLHPAARTPCAGCGWPYGAALAYSPATGCFVLCDACAELLAVQTVLTFALAAAFGR